MAKLQFLSGEFLGREVELVAGENPVGRTADNHVVINDPSVSRRHCVVLVHGREVIVREHGSHNGTYVANGRVDGQRFVDGGQVIRFGTVEARLVLGPGDRVEENSTLSATHDYQAFLEKERRHPEPPEAARPRPRPVAVKPEPATVVLAVDAQSAPRGEAAKQQKLRVAPSVNRARGRTTVIAGWIAAIAVLALIVWRLLRR